ncbi:hypothetical protein CPL00187_CDS0019 [Escherichia phage GoldenSnicker]
MKRILLNEIYQPSFGVAFLFLCLTERFRCL